MSASVRYPRRKGTAARPGAHHQGMRNKSRIRGGLGKHVAPTGYGFADAESEERERHFGQDVARNEDRCLRQDDAPRERQDVAADQVQPGGAEATGGQHEGAFAGAEDDAANHARGPHPADSADDGDQEEECLCGGNVQGQESAHGEQQIQPGKRQEEFPAAHQEAIDPTAVKAGEGTAEESQGEREEGGDQAGEQRDLTAIKDAREDVAAKTIAAPKKEDARRGDAEEAAAEQEINGIEAPTVFAEVPAKHILGDAVDEGTGVEAAGGIGKVDVGGWGEGVVAMLFGVIVRGEEGRSEEDRDRKSGV